MSTPKAGSSVEQRRAQALFMLSYLAGEPDDYVANAGSSSRFRFGPRSSEFSNFLFGFVYYCLEHSGFFWDLVGAEQPELVQRLNDVASFRREREFSPDALRNLAEWNLLRDHARALLSSLERTPTLPKKPWVIDDMIETSGYWPD